LFGVAAREEVPKKVSPPRAELPKLDGQTLAAFGAACIDHSATATCFHANQKTMGASAANFGGLVSTFHLEILTMLLYESAQALRQIR
jgi:hypothetical protein